MLLTSRCFESSLAEFLSTLQVANVEPAAEEGLTKNPSVTEMRVISRRSLLTNFDKEVDRHIKEKPALQYGLAEIGT